MQPSPMKQYVWWSTISIERDELAQTKRTRQRACLVRDAFHHAAVAHEAIRLVVDDLVAGLVEFGREQPLRDRHADRIGDALAKGARGGFDPRGDAHFRVPRGLRMQLAKMLQLPDRQRVTGQVKQRIDEHRAVAVREHEAIAVGPVRIRRVVAKVAMPQRHRDLGHAHRHARMPGIGRLDRIHREEADGVGQVRIGSVARARAGFGLRGWGVHQEFDCQAAGKTRIIANGPCRTGPRAETAIKLRTP